MHVPCRAKSALVRRRWKRGADEKAPVQGPLMRALDCAPVQAGSIKVHLCKYWQTMRDALRKSSKHLKMDLGMTADTIESPQRGATRKGVAARAMITAAALEVIAERGLAGVTHRAIAERAGIQLSMTTYHFRTLDDLIEASFDLFVERTHGHFSKFVGDTEEWAAVTLTQDLPAPARGAVIEQVATMVSTYVCTAMIERRIELAVECAFTFAWNPTDTLRDKVARYNQMLADMIARPLALAGSAAPIQDAEILTAVVRQLQFQHVTSGQVVDPEQVTVLIKRLLERLLF